MKKDTCVQTKAGSSKELNKSSKNRVSILEEDYCMPSTSIKNTHQSRLSKFYKYADKIKTTKQVTKLVTHTKKKD